MAEYKYSQAKINGKKKLRHRMIMEEHIGRSLLTKEYVHHINGAKKDNRIENLEIMDPVSHGRDHHLRLPLTKICPICEIVFTPHKTKRKRAKTCGVKCGYALSSMTQKGKSNKGVSRSIEARGKLSGAKEC